MPRHTCEQRTICGTWFSPSSVSIWEMDSGHQACQQVLLPTLPSHWPPSIFLTVLLTLRCVLPFIFDNHFFLMMCSGQMPLYPWIYFICYYNTQTQRVPTDGRRVVVLISYTAFLVPSKRLSMTTSLEPLIIRLSLLWPLFFFSLTSPASHRLFRSHTFKSTSFCHNAWGGCHLSIYSLCLEYCISSVFHGQ